MANTRTDKNPSPAMEASGFPALMTADEAARLANVTGRAMRSMCGRGEVAAVKLAGRWRVNRDALMNQLGLKAV